MRTKYCGELNLSHVNKRVTLCGWVNKCRNLGKIFFLDVRDREGVVQVFFQNRSTNLFQKAIKLRNEYCIQIMGIVKERNKQNKNYNILTGEIEVLALKLTILSTSKPIPLDLNKKNLEELRLKFRYLDLRCPNMTYNVIMRSTITAIIRLFMKKNKFLDVETPLLTRSTPEGARDYVVPSRIHKNKFYALPQSPQLFKQLLMISGIDRYYQIAKCFRDEDLRSDRQPEFTQIDIEASFATGNKIRNITERMIKNLWKKVLKINLQKFPTITFNDAIQKYGTDKPDLRNPIKFTKITDLFQDAKIQTCPKIDSTRKNKVIALCISGGSVLNNKQLKHYEEFVKNYTNQNLFFIKVDNIKKEKVTSPFIHLFNKNFIVKLLERTFSKDGDIIFFVSEAEHVVNEIMSILRTKIGTELHMIDKNSWKPVWIVDFPLFLKNEFNNYVSTHHPFTAPKNKNDLISRKNLENIRGNSYDLVINGYEIGSGSVRIHNEHIQKSVFEILGINKQKQKERFGFFLDALCYGTPPHAGIALGLDRITMLLTNNNNIRDVIAFPKTTTASCLTTEAPNIINNNILDNFTSLQN
ncbi:MAG: aspartate--tRNA ligase [Buchnera aphidicola (Nurudea ibofushi)]